ncbi:hypothetical protein TWF718_001729 [Orbilia javanica]|uniref:Uncharacterized protein n=1 Tax=Orbilia javanica TaxID=47235 RepID=A0AAN8RNH9_9PEZI
MTGEPGEPFLPGAFHCLSSAALTIAVNSLLSRIQIPELQTPRFRFYYCCHYYLLSLPSNSISPSKPFAKRTTIKFPSIALSNQLHGIASSSAVTALPNKPINRFPIRSDLEKQNQKQNSRRSEPNGTRKKKPPPRRAKVLEESQSQSDSIS